MNGDLGLGIVVSMKDAFSQNAQRIRGSMMDLDSTVADASERMTRNLDRIQQGTMMLGAGLALMAVPAALVASTAATQKALGELASLGVQDLRIESLRFVLFDQFLCTQCVPRRDPRKIKPQPYAGNGRARRGF